MIVYFTRTHDSYGVTLHIAPHADYPRHHPEHPTWSYFPNTNQSDLDLLVDSAKNAGIHVCYCKDA